MRLRTRLARGARRGYTLVELALAATLLTIALGSLVLLGDRSTDALGSRTSQAELDAHLRRTVARMVEELLPSGNGVLAPAAQAPGGSPALTYRRSAGPVNGVNTWGTQSRLAFALETGEIDDGLDNNGNGLADEGVVQWTRDLGLASEQTVVLCHGVRALGLGEEENGLDDDGDGLVDEGGLAFRREGGSLWIELTLAREELDGRFLVQGLQTVVQPRN